MRVAILLSFLAVCGLLELSQATTCTDATAKTCKKTLFMTGSCSGGVCSCANGYVAGKYGCQLRQKAVITTDPKHFNGEGIAAKEVALSCSAESDYEWYKDGTKVPSETILTFTITFGTTPDGSYTCKGKIAGLMSDASDAVVISTVGTLTKLPEVFGMPTKATTGMKTKLTCKNVPAGSTTYVWKIDSTVETGKDTQEYVIDFTSNANKDITCEVESKESAAVKTPASLDVDITGAEVKLISKQKLIKGEKLKLECQLTGGFPPNPTAGVTWNWDKDSTDASQSTNEYEEALTTVGTPSYECGATIATKSKKTSAAVVVTVSDSMAAGTITVSPSTPLNDGYTSLHCGYKTVSTSTPVTYRWVFDSKTLSGFVDHTIQLNEYTEASSKDYECYVTSEDGSVVTPTAPISTTATPASPTLTSTSGDEFGIGNTYTFVCNSDSYGPGGEYEWKVDSDIQTETSDTFKYTATATSVVLKCKYKFGSLASSEDTKSVQGKNIVSMKILVNGQDISNLKPVKASTLTLTCDVVKSKDAGALTYAWTKANAVSRKRRSTEDLTSKDYKLTLDDNTQAITVTCTATIGTETKTNEITLSPQATAEKPTISASPSNTPKLRADVSLECNSDSFGDGAKFEWKKDGTVIPGQTSHTYKISDIAATDDGDYSCIIEVGGQTSVASDPVTIATEPNEVQCTYVSDCDGDNFDSTVCTDNKCKCMSGYTLKGGLCSGSTTIFGSLLVILAAALVQRLF